jgi:hypothetical protein
MWPRRGGSQQAPGRGPLRACEPFEGAFGAFAEVGGYPGLEGDEKCVDCDVPMADEDAAGDVVLHDAFEGGL